MQLTKRIGAMICIAAVSTIVIGSMPAAADHHEEEKPALYDRLGGVYAIATVIDVFMDKLYVNETLNANPAIFEARNRVPMAGLKYRVIEMVCGATGGPCTYTGRSMKDTHKNLNITEMEWDAMVADLVATLDEFKVPKEEQHELLQILGSTKGDIVVTTSN